MYVFRTRLPVATIRRRAAPRLACIRPAASVHPEPGSNSPLLMYCSTRLVSLEIYSVLLYFFIRFNTLPLFLILSILFKDLIDTMSNLSLLTPSGVSSGLQRYKPFCYQQNKFKYLFFILANLLLRN